MVRFLTPEEMRIEVARRDLEEKLAKEFVLLELGAPAMESIAKIEGHSASMETSIKELIELARRAEARDEETRELLQRLLDKLRA